MHPGRGWGCSSHGERPRKGAEMNWEGWGAGGWLPHSLCPASVVWAGPSLSAGSQASSALSPEGSWLILRTGTYFSLKWL